MADGAQRGGRSVVCRDRGPLGQRAVVTVALARTRRCARVASRTDRRPRVTRPVPAHPADRRGTRSDRTHARTVDTRAAHRGRDDGCQAPRHPPPCTPRACAKSSSSAPASTMQSETTLPPGPQRTHPATALLGFAGVGFAAVLVVVTPGGGIFFELFLTLFGLREIVKWFFRTYELRADDLVIREGIFTLAGADRSVQPCPASRHPPRPLRPDPRTLRTADRHRRLGRGVVSSCVCSARAPPRISGPGSWRRLERTASA